MDEAGSPHFKLLAKWRVVHRTSGGSNAVCAVMERYKKITTINSDDLVQTEKRKTIKELFEGFSGEYVPEEIDWGIPVGKEEI